MSALEGKVAAPVSSLLPFETRLLALARKYSLHNFRYYDDPEGENLAGKLVATNRFALQGGLMYGSYMAFANFPEHEKGIRCYQLVAGRIAYFTLPAIACATAFTTTVYVATRLRKTDDR